MFIFHVYIPDGDADRTPYEQLAEGKTDDVQNIIISIASVCVLREVLGISSDSLKNEEDFLQRRNIFVTIIRG